MAEEYVPYIPPERTDVKEITIKAVIMGFILAVIMAAATTYFGLYVGMTVSAAIPAAVICFRADLKTCLSRMMLTFCNCPATSNAIP